MKEEARKQAASPPRVLDRAFANVRINWRVIELDRNQPEVKLTWDQYRSPHRQRVADRSAAASNWAIHRDLLGRVQAPLWGAAGRSSSGCGGWNPTTAATMGGFNVIEAVATLAWEGRRGAYFRGQLMDCLKIVQAGDIAPEQMVGSWAGAMGQTQFMPDSFLQLCGRFRRQGPPRPVEQLRRRVRLHRQQPRRRGLEGGAQPWGMRGAAARRVRSGLAGRDKRKPAVEWARLGVYPYDGRLPQPAGRAGLRHAARRPGGRGVPGLRRQFPRVAGLQPVRITTRCASACWRTGSALEARAALSLLLLAAGAGGLPAPPAASAAAGAALRGGPALPGRRASGAIRASSSPTPRPGWPWWRTAADRG